MSISRIASLRWEFIKANGSPPPEFQISRDVLDAIADEMPQKMFGPNLCLPDEPMPASEWRELMASQARNGNLYMFGIRVQLIDTVSPR